MRRKMRKRALSATMYANTFDAKPYYFVNYDIRKRAQTPMKMLRTMRKTTTTTKGTLP